MDLNPRVANYLLDASRHLQDDEMYRCSLVIEPRSSGSKNGIQMLSGAGSGQQVNACNQQLGAPGQPAGSGSASNIRLGDD